MREGERKWRWFIAQLLPLLLYTCQDSIHMIKLETIIYHVILHLKPTTGEEKKTRLNFTEFHVHFNLINLLIIL